MIAQTNPRLVIRAQQSDRSSAILRMASLAVIAIAVAYLCWNLIAPFISGFTWGLTIAIVCAPLRKSLFRWMPPLSATLLIIVAAILLMTVPLALALNVLVKELSGAQASLNIWLRADDWQPWISRHRVLGPLWAWADREMDFGAAAQQAAGALARLIAPAVVKSASFLSQAGVALLALFFFLRDQEVFLTALRRVLPLSARETEFFIERVSTAVRSSVYGRLLVGLLQGALGGVAFALVGLPAPVFWGVVTAFFSILPVLGAPVVWVPAGLLLFMTGHWIKGCVVAAWGIAVIHPVDNLLYPVLVGGRLGLHPLALFVAFVGGLIAFGPAGLILGPCVVAVAAGIGDVWLVRIDVALEGVRN